MNSTTQKAKISRSINPNAPNVQKHFWNRLVLLMAGIFIFFAYRFMQEEFQVSERAKVYQKPAHTIVKNVMDRSVNTIDQVLVEVDQMFQRRRYLVDDFVDDVTGYSFALNHSGRPSYKIQQIAIKKFKRDVISEQDINYQIGQSLISYRHRLNLTQDELVDQLETVFVSHESNDISNIKQQFKDDFIKLGKLSADATRITLPRLGIEVAIDLTIGAAITSAIEAALITAGISSGSGFAFGVSTLGIGFLVGFGIGAIADAMDDSDDKLEAECYRVLDSLKGQVKSKLRKQLEKDFQQRKSSYLAVVDDLARDKAKQDIAQGIAGPAHTASPNSYK